MDHNDISAWNESSLELPYSEMGIGDTLNLIFYNFPNGLRQTDKRNHICKYVLYKVKSVGHRNKLGEFKLPNDYEFHLSVPIECFHVAWRKSGTRVKFTLSTKNVRIKFKRVSKKTMLMIETEEV